MVNRDNRLKGSARMPRLTRTKLPRGILLLTGIFCLTALSGSVILSALADPADPVARASNLSPSPSLNPLEKKMLGLYLTLNKDKLARPASTDSSITDFEITPSETAVEIAQRLESKGLIIDADLLENYLQYYGLDRQLESGVYQLSPSMTIPIIAISLTHGAAREITITIVEGWRREQIAGWLDTQPGLPFTGSEFLAGTTNLDLLPESLRNKVSTADTLEGLLFPDTYRLANDADAVNLVTKMVERFDNAVVPILEGGTTVDELGLYPVIILASIVEREARVADERSLIASVYLNRLRAGMNLEADPTVQYAMGYQTASGEWWNLSLTQDDYLTVNSPFNTYLYGGLPPAPICNPGLASISAVLFPADTPYFYFRAQCDGSGRHSFAVTYDEHVSYACH